MSQLAERAIPVSAHVARYIAEYHGTKSASQPQWLAKMRESALEHFERLGFPTTKLEEWRFTPIGPISEKVFSLAPDGVADVDPQYTTPLAGGACVAACVNGRFAPQLSKLNALPKGVQVLSLETALATNPGLVEPYLARLAPVE